MLKWKRKSGGWQMPGAMLTAVVVIALSNAWSLSAGAKGLNFPQLGKAKVSGVKIETGPNDERVIISTRPETVPFSDYRWVDPPRIVVDLTGASLGLIPDKIRGGTGLVEEVDLQKLEPPAKEGEPKSLVRVIIKLKQEGEYRVERKGAEVIVTVKSASSADPSPATTKPGGEESSASSSPTPSEWLWDGPAAADSSPASSETASAEFDPAAVFSTNGKAAHNLLGVDVFKEDGLARVVIKTDGQVGDYSAFVLENPGRIVLDLWEIKNQAKMHEKEINDQGVLRLRAGEHDNKLRLAFDLAGPPPSFRVDKGADNLTVTFSQTIDVSASSPASPPSTEVSTAMASSPMAEAPEVVAKDPSGTATELAQATWDVPAMPDTAAAPPPPPGLLDWGPAYVPPPELEKEVGIAYIDAVRFEYTPEASTIILHADRPFRREYWTREDNEEEQVVSLFFSRSQLAADQQRSYDTKEFDSPIELFSVFQRPTKTNEVALVIVLRRLAASKWQQFDNKFVIQFENYDGSLGVGGAEKSGVFGKTVVSEEETIAGPVYTGKTISLKLKDMDILDALRLIADASGRNIVVSDEVRGKITIVLNNVPWDQALDIILETKGLGKIERGNIIRIAKKATIMKEKEEEAERAKKEREIIEPATAIIYINYLRAEDFKKLIDPMITPGKGSVNFDKRTNSIFIRDIPPVISDVRKLVESLDKPTRQVLIEARIVEATIGVTREIGVQWGANMNIGPATGTPTGVTFPSDIQIGGATLGGVVNPVLQAPGLSSGGGAIGLSVGHLTNVIDLDVILKALEAQRKIKIISSPRILTLTDQEATIEQGISIPYPPPAQSFAGTGTAQTLGWVFEEAALRLKVTPRVSATDNTVIMHVLAANNEPVTVPGADAPGISRKEAETWILLRDGETAVIGGIFKITEKKSGFQVPYLGNLPLIGPLFGDHITETQNEELIIFLTPQIIQPGSATGQPVVGAGVMN